MYVYGILKSHSFDVGLLKLQMRKVTVSGQPKEQSFHTWHPSQMLALNFGPLLPHTPIPEVWIKGQDWDRNYEGVSASLTSKSQGDPHHCRDGVRGGAPTRLGLGRGPASQKLFFF